MKKGPLCQSCPAYGFSSHMVPDEIKPGAQIYLLNQAPGANEEALGQPMVGKTGQAWESRFLKDAGLSRDQINVGNVIRCRWHGTDELPPVSSVLVKAAMRHCQQAYFTIPPSTRLLVAAGDYACQALTGSTVADGDKAGSGWRGYLKPYDPITRESKAPQKGSTALTEAPVGGYYLPSQGDIPVLVTWHVARTFHEPKWIIPLKVDWGKVPRYLAGKWPIQPPRMLAQPPQPWPRMFTFDSEYDGETPKGAYPTLYRYSMCWGVGDEETCVVEAGQHRPAVSLYVVPPRVVMQYSPADVQHLDRLTEIYGSIGLSVWDRFLIEDAVWKHAILWSDHQHDLNYLGSLYTPFNRWKHLGGSHPTLYAGMDATGLYYVDRALEQELDSDPRSRHVWETIDRPALGEFVRAQYRGLRTDPDRVASAIAQLQAEVDQSTLAARAIAGWPIKLSSNPMVADRLYAQEDLKPS